MSGSELASRILAARASGVSALKSSTVMPISAPYLILSWTYFWMTGLSESRKIRSLGVDFSPRTSWAWRSLIKPASSLPFKIFISELRRG